MEKTHVKNVYLDYNSISLRLDTLAQEVTNEGYDGIVMILRGGTFAGMHLAFLTDYPFYFLRYNRESNTVSWLGEVPMKEKLLLVEDFAGMGVTLINSKEFLEDAGFKVDTFVICKDLKSASVPKYHCFDLKIPNARFILPWERHLLNPETKTKDRKEKLSDHAYERTAWDLDGVFLEDVESTLYIEDVEAALELRSQLPLAKFAPFPRQGDVIITGRVIEDKLRTLKWLEQNNVTIPIILRDIETNNHTNETNAKWKGQKAVNMGYTHYVESDAEQALYIASNFPELRVTWWNKGNPINISATIIKDKDIITL